MIDLSKKKRTTDQFILVRRDQAPHDSTTGPSSQPDDDTSEKVIHESSSRSDSERTESETEVAAPKGDKDQDPEKAYEALAGPDPEPMQEDQTGSDPGKVHVSLAGPNPEHRDDEFLATAYPKIHENLKLITDERVIEDNLESHSGSMSSMKNLEDTDNFGDQFLYDKPTEDDQEKSKVVDESDSTIPDLSHQTVMSTPPVIAPITDFSSPKPSSLFTPPPINTEATTITTSLPEITPFIALQLRVARLEQEMSEVKKTDILLMILERHTTDLIEKYSVLPGPESIKNQESEKSPKEIIRIKREQGEEKQDSTYSIRSTDKVDLEEFDLKSALFKHMNKNKSANRNPANYHLYHALMEALIADEDAMDKEVKDRVKNHKRKHDSDDDEDDDDDEGPSAGSNQGKSSKRRRHDSGASGSSNHLYKKMMSKSSKKPRENIPEQSSDDIPMQDEGHVSDLMTPKTIPFPPSTYFPSSGLKVIKQRSTLNVQIGMRDYFFKNTIRLVPKGWLGGPRAVIYKDRNDQRKLMRLNEIQKFRYGTLTRVMEKLYHMVKDFHLFEYNKGMETRKWLEDDKRRSKDFITTIEKRLQIRRIFRSLESFVRGRIRDIDYRLINRTT
ncbi:hypothetical protein Tco_0974593 [Tanacetum coccineum]|uniref:Uncharacterized protein n=1 Tax=Tanacetum coccineum TaxID=301880 RepID=A0ABQ5EC09_9ASTR